MVNPEHLERLVLEAVAKVGRDAWVPFSVGELRNRVAEADKQAGDASPTELVETVIALEAGNQLSIQKWQGSPAILVPYDRASSQREIDGSAFFFRGSFELRLTHDGRKTLGQIKVFVADSVSEPDELDDRLPLYRKKIFDADLAEFSATALNAGQPLSLVMIDLDHFKEVNDHYGHLAGDEVLVALSELIAARVNGKGKAYRYGGDEFAILLRNYTLEEATVLAEIVRKGVESARLLDGKIRMTASLGVAGLPEHATNPNALLEFADKASYQAKNLGRNLVRVSGEPEKTPETPRQIRKREPNLSGLSEEMEQAIRETYFRDKQATCPYDGAILRVIESGEVGLRTPHLHVSCPLCGLIQKIRAPL